MSDLSDNETQTETIAKNRQKDNEEKIMNDQTGRTAEIKNKQQNSKFQNRHNHKIGSEFIVIGDSLLKNI